MAKKHAGGRPRTYNDKQTEEIKKLLNEYINKTDVPILAEFAYQNNIPRTTFYDYPEFSTLIKKLIDKKESQLEKLALFNVINSTMAVFSLKQIGWRNEQEVNVKTDLEEFSKAMKNLESDDTMEDFEDEV